MSSDINVLIAPCISVSLSDSASQYNKPGLPVIVVDNDHCRAVIALQGAQLLEFDRKTDGNGLPTPFLWLSPNAIFAADKAIRGGIPICFPWFGPHSQDPALPQHGFARNRDWLLIKSSETADTTKLTFALTSSDETQQVYPHAFRAELHFSLGKTLTIELSVHNLSDNTMPVGWALHSYFPVNDTATATVPELVGTEYVDKTDDSREKQLTKNLDFSQHTDAVFTRSPDMIALVRPEGNLAITSENAPTTITWNPNTRADTMADLGPDTYRQFVCVERGAAFDDGWELPAGESIHARMNIDNAP